MSSPENARAVLIAGGIDANLIKIGTLPGSPDRIIAIADAPGQAPNPRWLLDYPALHVLVRGDVEDYNSGKVLGTKVKDLLLGIDSFTASNGDRWNSVQMRGDVDYIGPDDNKRHVFSLNFGLIIEPVANADTNREALPL